MSLQKEQERWAAQKAALDKLDEHDREVIESCVKTLSKKVRRVGRMTALDTLASIGVYLAKNWRVGE